MADFQFWRMVRTADHRAAKRQENRLFYTVAEVAAFLGVTDGTVRRHYIKTGRLAAAARYRGGNPEDPRSWRYVVAWADLKAFLETDLFPGRPRMLRMPPVRERDYRGRFASQG